MNTMSPGASWSDIHPFGFVVLALHGMRQRDPGLLPPALTSPEESYASARPHRRRMNRLFDGELHNRRWWIWGARRWCQPPRWPAHCCWRCCLASSPANCRCCSACNLRQQSGGRCIEPGVYRGFGVSISLLAGSPSARYSPNAAPGRAAAALLSLACAQCGILLTGDDPRGVESPTSPTEPPMPTPADSGPAPPLR